MPVSKHRKKGRTAREWRKNRNNRRAREQSYAAMEKRGMKKAMQIMQEQYESEKEILAEEVKEKKDD